LWQNSWIAVLREMLSIKADDVKGRNLAFEALYTGKPINYFGAPESLWRLAAVLRALNLELILLDEEGKEVLPEMLFPKIDMDPLFFDQSVEAGKKIKISGFGIRAANKNAIRLIAYGEVKNTKTIDYKTLKPARDGLFCERIFGPEKNFSCACGKYRKRKNENIVCENCGVEVTSSFVRRRFGSIKLNMAVVHPLYLKQLALTLELPEETLKKLANFENFLLTEMNLPIIKRLKKNSKKKRKKPHKKKIKKKKNIFLKV
jgi:hypothetical protein